MPLDGICQALLSPKAADQDLATEFADHGLYAVGDSAWIPCIVVAIENKKTFVGCVGQRDYSSLRTDLNLYV
jgi:hypothetical protein